MNDYTSTTDIKADVPDSPLFASTDSTYDAALATMISAASRAIDREVGRWPGYFYPSSDDQTRYFDGSGDEAQIIDEMVSITSLAVAESGGTAVSDYTDWILGTDYIVWPYNYLYIGKPIMALRIVENGDKANFPSYAMSIKVTGIFGYSSTPPSDIVQACKIQAFRWFSRAKQGYQDASASASLGQIMFTRQLDPDVAEILLPYKTGNLV